MKFSGKSDVTVVITSCGRFDLLERTLKSLDEFNTYPVRKVIITEDSGSDSVFDVIPAAWAQYVQVFVNNPKLGQLRSIDLAYANVETEWVFHCEDDWQFYRTGFIEDSMLLLKEDKQALQVWLRSFAHDLQIHSPYVYLGERKQLEGVVYHELMSHKEEWQGFSFNPGLRRLADYKLHAPYQQFSGEKALSKLYADETRYALILENDAVLHTGFGEHVVSLEEKNKKNRRKKLAKLKNVVFLAFGLVVGFIVGAV